MYLIRKIRRHGDALEVDISNRNGTQYTAHIFQSKSPEPPPGTFLAGTLRSESTDYYTAPQYLMGTDGSIVDLRAHQYAPWFRQMMGRIIFAK